ncbi:MAG: hypothetical protein Q9173_006452 [Seirophora scorigena]
MKLLSVYAVAGSGTLLFSSVLARRGLSPDDIPLFTRTVKFTFIQICDEVQNPTPQPMFNEAKNCSRAHEPQKQFAKTIMGMTRDLYTFLLGYSLDTSIKGRPGRTPPLKQKEHTFSKEPRISSAEETQPPVDHLPDDLVDELIKSHETSDILASRDRLFDSNAPEDHTLTQQDPTTHRYTAGRGFDCGKFQRDLKDVRRISPLLSHQT